MAASVAAATRPFEATDRPVRWGWIETFILLQFLAGGLLFLPGAQSFRVIIRALPYISSLGLFVFYLGKSSRSGLPAGGKFLVLALALLMANLAHPMTQFSTGLAQCVFQFCIAAPVFWVGKVVQSQTRLSKLLWLIFLFNAINAGIGLLQVYYPERFMPPEFSAIALGHNPDYVESLSYTGNDGKMIVRPPGLSDVPGGAAVAGLITGVLGIALGVQRGQLRFIRLLSLAAAGVGMVILYLTQVRSLLLMMLVSLVALWVFAIRQRLGAESGRIALISTILVIGSFFWATSIGGESVSQRFLSVIDDGLINSYQQNRGRFVTDTVDDLMYEFPLGAGLGRWGIIYTYFGDDAHHRPPHIHAEIQMTGWLLDGGVLMWLFYGGAVFAAMAYTFRLVVSRSDPRLAYLAGIIFCIQLFIVGMSLAGPVFNTQLGIQFWFLVAALHGAAKPEPTRVAEVQHL